jgi:hypothetical protein
MPLPLGFIAPCLPTKAPHPPSGDAWLHEIKHDGFRVIARKDGPRVRLYSRPGNDLTNRFPLIVEALTRLRTFPCIIDGEAVRCDDKGPSIIYFGGGGSAAESSLSGLADMVRSCGIVELPPDTWLLPDIPERAISYEYMTSQAWRSPVPHIQTAS